MPTNGQSSTNANLSLISANKLDEKWSRLFEIKQEANKEIEKLKRDKQDVDSKFKLILESID